MIYKNFLVSLVVCCNILIPVGSTAASQNPPLSGHQVKINDKPVMLMGNSVVLGQKAPNFKVVDEQFNPIELSSFNNQLVLISVVPSIDTGICSLQTKKFNEQVLELPINVKLLTISADLPFAQKRFCIEESVDAHQLLSDAVWRDFGLKYGLLIKDMGLLSRAVLIIDETGNLAYQQIVPQLSKEPDYEEALTTLKAMIPNQSEAAVAAEK